MLEYIGRNSLGILVLHKFPIVLFQKVIPYSSSALRNPDSLMGIIVGVIVSFVAVETALLVTKVIMKVAPFCFGLTKKQ